MKKTNIYYLIIFLVLSSCSTVIIPSKSIDPNEMLISDEGMIIGTIALQTTNNANKIKYTFDYSSDKIEISENKSIDKKESGNVIIAPPRSILLHHEPDFIDGEFAVYFFKIKKINGNFHFYGLTTTDIVGTGMGTAELNTFTKINIPFEVEKGKIKYLGEIKYTEKVNQLGGRRIERIPQVNFEVKRERDTKKFNEMFPKIKLE